MSVHRECRYIKGSVQASFTVLLLHLCKIIQKNLFHFIYMYMFLFILFNITFGVLPYSLINQKKCFQFCYFPLSSNKQQWKHELTVVSLFTGYHCVWFRDVAQQACSRQNIDSDWHGFHDNGDSLDDVCSPCSTRLWDTNQQYWKGLPCGRVVWHS